MNLCQTYKELWGGDLSTQFGQPAVTPAFMQTCSKVIDLHYLIHEKHEVNTANCAQLN